MKFADPRVKIKVIILGITGFIIAILVLGALLNVLGMPKTDFPSSLIQGVGNIFILPFKGLLSLPTQGKFDVISADAIIACIMYALGGLILVEFITSFLPRNPGDIIQDLIDAVFKVIEFILVLRIVFELFNILNGQGSSPFVQTIYGLTDWTQLVSFRVQFFGGNINLLAIVALVIVAIIDSLTESFLISIFLQIKGGVTRTVTKVVDTSKVVGARIPVVQMPFRQNVVVNVPSQQQVAPVYYQQAPTMAQPVVVQPSYVDANGQPVVVVPQVQVTPQYVEPQMTDQ